MENASLEENILFPLVIHIIDMTT